MHEPGTKPSVYRFSSFELDSGLGELRKHGTRIRLQDQPLQILVLLLEHAGELVTREQIQNALWPQGTFVDYDNAINSAMRKLREAIGDDSGDPRFIETLARRGYRFIGQLEKPRIETRPESAASTAPPAPKTAPLLLTRANLAFLVGGALLVLAAGAAWRLAAFRTASVRERIATPSHETESIPQTPVPLNAGIGAEGCPGFSPDGNQVAYSWTGSENPNSISEHVYLKSVGSGKPLQLTTDARPDFCPSWSPDGRTLAFSRGRNPDIVLPFGPDQTWRLGDIYAIAPLGGSERMVAEGLFNRVSWSPDGRFLATSMAGSREADTSSLYLVNVENGVKSILTPSPYDKTKRLRSHLLS